MNCPTCGRSWFGPNVGSLPPNDVGAWQAGGINWAEVLVGVALGAALQVYLWRVMR